MGDGDAERFLEMLAGERGSAANTVAAYRRDLDRLRRHLAGAPLRDADGAALAGFMAADARAGAAPRTAARRLSCFRQFFRFLLTEAVRPDDPTALLDPPKRGLDLPRTLTEAEVATLLDAARALPGARGQVAHAAIALLYATGLRVSELLALERAAFRAGEAETGGARVLLVRGKGGRERIVPLTDEARIAATTLAASPPPGRRFLFGGRDRDRALTRQGFDAVLADAARAAGLAPNRLSPHVLRHSVASHLLARGLDLRHIQALLGHADIATTAIYTHLDAGRLGTLLGRHHPLAASPATAPTAVPGAPPSGADETC